MIVYLATYPRSGNSLLQEMLRRNFGIRRADVEPGAPRDLGVTIGAPGSVAIRQRLAGNSEQTAYLKTHARPFSPFVEGERVIQFVRHPGASLWSYFRLITDKLPAAEVHRFRGRSPTLDAVVAGEIGTGNWSTYHEEWMVAANALPDRYLSFRYEDVIADQPATRGRISEFLRAPERSDVSVSFESYHRRKSAWDVRGTSSGYEQFYSRRQLELLWNTHGATAEKFGYSPPDFDAAAPDEQVRRLTNLLETAWDHAAGLESRPWRRLERQARRKLQQIGASFRRPSS